MGRIEKVADRLRSQWTGNGQGQERGCICNGLDRGSGGRGRESGGLNSATGRVKNAAEPLMGRIKKKAAEPVTDRITKVADGLRKRRMDREVGIWWTLRQAGSRRWWTGLRKRQTQSRDQESGGQVEKSVDGVEKVADPATGRIENAGNGSRSRNLANPATGRIKKAADWVEKAVDGLRSGRTCDGQDREGGKRIEKVANGSRGRDSADPATGRIEKLVDGSRSGRTCDGQDQEIGGPCDGQDRKSGGRIEKAADPATGRIKKSADGSRSGRTCDGQDHEIGGPCDGQDRESGGQIEKWQNLRRAGSRNRRTDQEAAEPATGRITKSADPATGRIERVADGSRNWSRKWWIGARSRDSANPATSRIQKAADGVEKSQTGPRNHRRGREIGGPAKSRIKEAVEYAMGRIEKVADRLRSQWTGNGQGQERGCICNGLDRGSGGRGRESGGLNSATGRVKNAAEPLMGRIKKKAAEPVTDRITKVADGLRKRRMDREVGIWWTLRQAGSRRWWTGLRKRQTQSRDQESGGQVEKSVDGVEKVADPATGRIENAGNGSRSRNLANPATGRIKKAADWVEKAVDGLRSGRTCDGQDREGGKRIEKVANGSRGRDSADPATGRIEKLVDGSRSGRTCDRQDQEIGGPCDGQDRKSGGRIEKAADPATGRIEKLVDGSRSGRTCDRQDQEIGGPCDGQDRKSGGRIEKAADPATGRIKKSADGSRSGRTCDGQDHEIGGPCDGQDRESGGQIEKWQNLRRAGSRNRRTDQEAAEPATGRITKSADPATGRIERVADGSRNWWMGSRKRWTLQRAGSRKEKVMDPATGRIEKAADRVARPQQAVREEQRRVEATGIITEMAVSNLLYVLDLGSRSTPSMGRVEKAADPVTSRNRENSPLAGAAVQVEQPAGLSPRGSGTNSALGDSSTPRTLGCPYSRPKRLAIYQSQHMTSVARQPIHTRSISGLASGSSDSRRNLASLVRLDIHARKTDAERTPVEARDSESVRSAAGALKTEKRKRELMNSAMRYTDSGRGENELNGQYWEHEGGAQAALTEVQL
ncbi:hypothetical protein DFH11DRAFT_1547012 [Phellopilus nigrolimitatus]|nr:hypothetical protein DFH11DRAFT_1547012 [Phellopilus nigrolimitatus]